MDNRRQVTSSKKFQGWNLAWEALLILSLLTAAIFLISPGLTEAFRNLVRATARISLVLFSMAFVASSAFYLWPQSDFFKWILKNRRYIGVSFAISHLFHLVGIIGLGVVDTENFFATTAWTTFVFGGLVFILIFFMLLTSFDRSARWVSAKTWKIGHNIGNYGIWFVFMVGYFGRIVVGRFAYVPLALLIVLSIAIRYFAWKKKKNKKTMLSS